MMGKAAAAQVPAAWAAAAVTVLARVQRVGDTADINEGYIPLRTPPRLLPAQDIARGANAAARLRTCRTSPAGAAAGGAYT